jgi:MYXO-CTERM domain-containing protein
MDCDDADPAVFPGAREVCDNGVDDDCDGQLDEGCGGGGCAAGGTAADTVVPFVLVALGMALRRRSVASGR